jgi:hypothetical protein
VEYDIIIIVKIKLKTNIKILYLILSQVQHLYFEDYVYEPFNLISNKSQASHKAPECPRAHKSLEV